MRLMPAWLLVVVIVAGVPALGSAQAVQTQMAMEGTVEVDVVRAAVQEGVLTVVLAYRNTGKSPVERVTASLNDVYYIEDGEKKKYHVLADSKNQWIASPAAHGSITLRDLPPGGKKMAWVKFPAPPDGVKTVNLVIPGVLPFEKLPVSR